MKTLYTTEEIEARVDELAREITTDYRDADEGRNLVLVGVLKGSFVFMADLMRRLPLAHEIDFIAVSSYGASTRSSGSVRLLKDLDTDIKDRDVLLVEDIVDTGNSLAYIRHSFEIREPRSLKVATLLDKKERREQEVDVDYVAFEIPDHFVVGYGMDYDERYRDLPYVGILDPSETEATR